MTAVAGGIDLGGTKIEAQRFDAGWAVVETQRIPTPPNYDALVQAVVDQVAWLRRDAPNLPVGIAAAGLAVPKTGHWLAANLAANGRPFVADVANKIDKPITWLNDSRAFTQAEAIFGGPHHGTLVGLILGTGIGGGVVVDGKLINQGAGMSGEFGHMPLSSATLAAHNLPVFDCTCGRRGCYETLASGPGMERLAEHLTGQDLTTHQIVAGRDDPAIGQVWRVWCEVIAALIISITTMVDPKNIVLGGGLSQVPGLIRDLEQALKELSWEGFPLPTLRLGRHGPTAAALGAAYAAAHV